MTDRWCGCGVVVQFAADAPLSIQCLLYVPQMSVEKMGESHLHSRLAL